MMNVPLCGLLQRQPAADVLDHRLEQPRARLGDVDVQAQGARQSEADSAGNFGGPGAGALTTRAAESCPRWSHAERCAPSRRRGSIAVTSACVRIWRPRSAARSANSGPRSAGSHGPRRDSTPPPITRLGRDTARTRAARRPRARASRGRPPPRVAACRAAAAAAPSVSATISPPVTWRSRAELVVERPATAAPPRPRAASPPAAARPRPVSEPPMSWWIAICRCIEPAFVPDASRLSSPRSSSTTSTPARRGSRRARRRRCRRR